MNSVASGGKTGATEEEQLQRELDTRLARLAASPDSESQVALQSVFVELAVWTLLAVLLALATLFWVV